MATTESSRYVWWRNFHDRIRSFNFGVPLVGLWASIFAVVVALSSPNVAASPSDGLSVPSLDQAIGAFAPCKNKKSYPERSACGVAVLDGLLDVEAMPKSELKGRCIIDGSPYRIYMLAGCIEWLKGLKEGLKQSDIGPAVSPVSPTSLLGPAAVVAAVKEVPGAVSSASTPPEPVATGSGTQSTAEVASGALKVPTVSDFAAPEARAKVESASPTYLILIWLLGGLVAVLIVALTVMYLKLSGTNDELRERIAEKDREVARLTKKNQDQDDNLAQVMRDAAREKPVVVQARATSTAVSAAAAAPQAPRMDATLEVIAPPKTERPRVSPHAMQVAVLAAIESLARERVSLTETNFVNKVAGCASNAYLKAALTEHLEPAQFYLCNGSRSAQGPDLLAYRIKGQAHCSVVPFPTAGRVGQFIRWFENAGNTYELDPVLAAKPAVGIVNEAGVLVVSSLGTLA